METMDRIFVRLASLLLLVLVITTLTSALICPKKTGKDPTDVSGRLQALVKASNEYTYQDGKYFYRWRVCAKSDADNVAIEQTGDQIKGVAALGRQENARLVGGTDWFFITYPNGDRYNSHCNKAPRKASVMVTCDPNAVKGTLSMLEEYRDVNKTSPSTDECYYLFEINHKAACTVKPPDNSLSPGSILLIVMIIITGVYLILGFLYQRFVAGAKGLEQIPNYHFWISFGSLQADGCDFFCRCKKKKRSPAYKPVEDALSDNPHHDIPETDDENLLPAV